MIVLKRVPLTVAQICDTNAKVAMQDYDWLGILSLVPTTILL